MALPPRSCFQFFGLDFILDASLKPWCVSGKILQKIGEITTPLFTSSSI